LPGLGWLEAETVRFKFDGTDPSLKIPHMGWNTVQISQPHPIFNGIQEELRFYFVHSYHVVCRNRQAELGKTTYGYEFTSVVGKDNILGTQFHPEKSHKFGMALLKNFVERI
jgi:glutamine amidotransferase